MRPTRRSQPYRKGPRAASPVLTNMKRGKTLYGQNPQDAKRAMAKLAGKRRRRRKRRRAGVVRNSS